jgi:hypothetical protein
MLKKKIFISYKRNVEPDEPVAISVYNKLRQNYDVFIDQTMLVGAKWAKQIESQLRKTDYLITFISKDSVNSDMVLAEIETAYRLNKKYRKPIILPVRLNYTEKLVYPLSAYLNPINYVLWEEESDTNEIIAQLELAISGQKLSNKKIIKGVKRSGMRAITEPSSSVTPITFESPEGTMNPHSQFYIERDGDQIALDAIKQQGVTITIKGPRQMGKSTLLNRIVESAINKQASVVFLDFQLIEESILSDQKSFYQYFCRWLTYELGLQDKVDQYWKIRLGNTQLCTNYIKEHVLESLKHPLLIAMDEVEKMFETKFRSDFFGMLRNWHNNRSNQAEWNKLDLALVTSTEPYLFVDNLNQSPFNVGEIIELEDFTIEHVAKLNKQYGQPLSASEVGRIFDLLGGHPYLTRKSLYLVATKKHTLTELIEKSVEDNGPFGDHLRGYLFRLHSKKELLDGLIQVITKKKCSEKEFFRLRGAGLVRRENGLVILRNNLYKDYLQKRLNA